MSSVLTSLPRDRRPELIDAPDLDPGEHRHALHALNQINRWLGIDRRLFRAVQELGSAATLSIVDVGAGGGGFLNYVAKRRGENGPPLVAADWSTLAMRQTRAWSTKGVFAVVADARRLPFADASVDVVTCSLFLHHFDPDEVVAILSEAARVARKGMVFSDLVRSRLALALTWATTRATSRSRVFHSDGTRSVRAAFIASELKEFARRAGLRGARVQRQFPFRALLVWSKTVI